MINAGKNKALNKKLLDLYHQKTDAFLQEYRKAFSNDKNPPDYTIMFSAHTDSLKILT